MDTPLTPDELDQLVAFNLANPGMRKSLSDFAFKLHEPGFTKIYDALKEELGSAKALEAWKAITPILLEAAHATLREVHRKAEPAIRLALTPRTAPN